MDRKFNKTYVGPLHFYDRKNFKYKVLMSDKRLTAGGIFFYETRYVSSGDSKEESLSSGKEEISLKAEISLKEELVGRLRRESFGKEEIGKGSFSFREGSPKETWPNDYEPVKGLWLLKEEEYGKDVYTDFGGKYDYNDGDIYATISREFREEVYNTQEITYKQVASIPKDHHVFINGYDDNPVYLCILVHIDTFNIRLDSEAIKKEKLKILKRNSKVPPTWYKTIDVEFVPLKDIQSGKIQISRRLRAILKQIMRHIGIYNEEIQSFFSDFYFV